MTAAICGLAVIGAVILAGVAGALAQEHREARAAEASRTAPASAHGPAVTVPLPLPCPSLDRDGEPLSEQEWAALVGCLFASQATVPEPDYRGRP